MGTISPLPAFPIPLDNNPHPRDMSMIFAMCLPAFTSIQQGVDQGKVKRIRGKIDATFSLHADPTGDGPEDLSRRDVPIARFSGHVPINSTFANMYKMDWHVWIMPFGQPGGSSPVFHQL